MLAPLNTFGQSNWLVDIFCVFQLKLKGRKYVPKKTIL